MALGYKTGGRTAGTPNHKTQVIAELPGSLGCDPIEGMARIAMDERNRAELLGRMFAQLAQYIHPKRKAVEHSGDSSAPAFQLVVMPAGAEARDLPR